jgi:hypothetical protein
MWIKVPTITLTRNSEYMWMQVPTNGPPQMPWTGYGQTGSCSVVASMYGGGSGGASNNTGNHDGSNSNNSGSSGGSSSSSNDATAAAEFVMPAVDHWHLRICTI